MYSINSRVQVMVGGRMWRSCGDPAYVLNELPCAGYGRREAVEILLNAGANVHARDDGGLIPLHNACSFGHAEVCSLLPRTY